MSEAFTAASRVRDVVDRLGDTGRTLLRNHGYDVGDGFTDVLSQFQSLENAYRVERIRDLKGLLEALNSAQ